MPDPDISKAHPLTLLDPQTPPSDQYSHILYRSQNYRRIAPTSFSKMSLVLIYSAENHIPPLSTLKPPDKLTLS